MSLDSLNPLSAVALALTLLSAAILVGFLVRRPKLDRVVKVWLLIALGPLPITAAMTGNLANFEVTTKRTFCASCHTMTIHANDAADPHSTTLASLHSKNPYFGDKSCYVCHADYGMFGTVLTKVGGMHHVWDYYTDDWSAPGHRPPQLYKPYSNTACMQCHPVDKPRQPLEHKIHGQAVKDGLVSCAAANCHGPPHPRATAQKTVELSGGVP
jgi:nitrate/TMAO reductase-like tetraheme cytochrome c subunit